MTESLALSSQFVDDRPWYHSESHVPAPPGRDDLRCERFCDEAVLFDPLTNATFHLNATAMFVWERCRPGFTIPDIAQALANRYDTDLERAIDDVEQLIALFANHGLLATYSPADSLL